MARGPLRVGLIGLGAIGGSVVRLAGEHASDDVVIVGALVRDPGRKRAVSGPPIVASLDALLAEEPEVVVEAGGRVLRSPGDRWTSRGRASPTLSNTCWAKRGRTPLRRQGEPILGTCSVVAWLRLRR